MKNYKYLGLSSLLALFLTFSATGQTFNGYALYNLLNQNTAYLIDENGNIAHSWSSSVSCNYAVKLKDNGNIVRGGVYSGNQIGGAAVGGMIQEIDPSGTVVWEYIYSNADHVSHHDFCVMPNGNVILTAWEVKSTAELTQAGFSNATSEKWPTHFVELQPDGAGSATIVWEWHMWDHLAQDVDSGKDNYVTDVANYPELMDINAISGGGGGPGGPSGDWFHVNGIDYNADLDQLVFSSRFASEFFIIDHSTTTAEAASHAGGNSGMGGDFIFRWGNPSNYGSTGPQTIDAAVHDPRWIPAGRPNAGYIQFFNNEGGTSGGSVVDAINPPVNGFLYDMTGNYYGPANYDWRHVCLTSNTGQSASDRMTNGNTFVNVSQQYMYEVDANDNLIWQYNAGPAKAFRYECDHPGIEVILGPDPCGLLAINEETLSDIEFYPNPSSTGVFNISGVDISASELEIQVLNVYGELVAEIENSETIDISNEPAGVYYVRLVFNENDAVTKKVSLIK